jgi:hypothetical protein
VPIPIYMQGLVPGLRPPKPGCPSVTPLTVDLRNAAVAFSDAVDIAADKPGYRRSISSDETRYQESCQHHFAHWDLSVHADLNSPSCEGRIQRDRCRTAPDSRRCQAGPNSTFGARVGRLLLRQRRCNLNGGSPRAAAPSRTPRRPPLARCSRHRCRRRFSPTLLPPPTCLEPANPWCGGPRALLRRRRLNRERLVVGGRRPRSEFGQTLLGRDHIE